jgi:hypothetical protein
MFINIKENCKTNKLLLRDILVNNKKWTKLINTSVSSTNKTDRHNMTEILLKVVLNTINQIFYTHFVIFLLNVRK